MFNAPYYKESAKEKKERSTLIIVNKAARRITVMQTPFEKGVCSRTKRTSDFLNNFFHRCAQDMNFPHVYNGPRAKYVRRSVSENTVIISSWPHDANTGGYTRY